MDRRVKKTRELLMDTLICLMGEKGFERITIQEIADRANVNRGTVYLHFEDKYALLDQCVQMSLYELQRYCKFGMAGELSPKDSVALTFKFMEDHAFLYKTLLRNDSVSGFRRKLIGLMRQSIETQFVAGVDSMGIQRDVLIEFTTSAAIGVLEWWFHNNMPYSADEITEQILNILASYHVVPGLPINR